MVSAIDTDKAAAALLMLDIPLRSFNGNSKCCTVLGNHTQMHHRMNKANTISIHSQVCQPSHLLRHAANRTGPSTLDQQSQQTVHEPCMRACSTRKHQQYDYNVKSYKYHSAQEMTTLRQASSEA